MNHLRTISINKITIHALIFAFVGEIIRLIIQNIPLGLTDKIAISCIYVLMAYIYMFKYCIQHKLIENVFFMLLILSVFFYYGQHILALIDPNYLFTQQNYHILDGRISDASIIHATFLAIECLLVVFSGFICLKKDEEVHDNQINSNSVIDETKLQALRIGGWIVIIISFYPTIKYLLAQLSLTQIYGYLGRRNLESQSNYNAILGISTMYIYVSNLFLPGLYALFIGYKNRKKFVIYLLITVYCILYYMTGSRFMILKALISLFLIQSIWIKHLKREDIKKYIIIAIVVAAIFSMGNIIRSAGNENMNFTKVAGELSIGGMLWEPGITFTTISNAIECCPAKVDYFYGKSLLGAILQCLPSALRFGFFDKYTLQVSAVLSPLYYHTSTFGYGSSFIAEGFYNFGYLIYVYMFVYGLLLGKIRRDLQHVNQNNSPYLFLILVALCGSLTFGVRNDLSSVPREMLTTVIIVAFIVKIIETLIRGKKGDTTRSNI